MPHLRMKLRQPVVKDERSKHLEFEHVLAVASKASYRRPFSKLAHVLKQRHHFRDLPNGFRKRTPQSMTLPTPLRPRMREGLCLITRKVF